MPSELKHLYRRTVKGNPYVYFRSPIDGALTRLPSDETSVAFKRLHKECLKAIGQNALPPKKQTVVLKVANGEGTLGAAITRYKTSTTYEQIKPGTKLAYERSLEDLNAHIGAGLLADLDVDVIDIHTEEIAKAKGLSVADRHVRLISSIWQEVKKYPEFGIKGKGNPADDAKLRYKVRQPHRPWNDAEQTRFMQTAPEYLQLGKLLLHFGAQRGGDCVKMLWTQFDGKGIWVTPEKSDANPDPLPNYHLCPKPLLEALNAAPRVAETILTNSRGEPWRHSMGLSHAIRNHLIKVGLAKRGARSITMHGLRKNAASEVGELLVGTAGIKTVTGHRSNDMAEYYAQHASRRAMNEAVVAKWNDAIEAKVKATRRMAAGIRRVK